MRAVVARKQLELSENIFEVFKNPMHAWHAYREARRAGVSVPEWVLTYFDDCAAGLLATPEAADSASEVSKCMRFPRRAGTRAREQGKYHLIVVWCREGRRRNPGAPDELIFGEVGARCQPHLTTERVSAIFHKYTDAQTEMAARPKTTRRGRRRK